MLLSTVTLTLVLQQLMYGKTIIPHSYLKYVINNEEGLPPQAALSLSVSLSEPHTNAYPAKFLIPGLFLSLLLYVRW